MITIENEAQLAEIKNESFRKLVVIFKNSTRCGISQSTLSSFKNELGQSKEKYFGFYLLDIVKNGDISSAIASDYNVKHESPQLLLISKGECVYHKNHWNISFYDLAKHISDIKSTYN